VFLGY